MHQLSFCEYHHDSKYQWQCAIKGGSHESLFQSQPNEVPRKLHGWEIALIAVGCILFLLLLLAFMWRMRGKHEVKKIYEHNLFSV